MATRKSTKGQIRVKATPALVAALGLKPKGRKPTNGFKKGKSGNPAGKPKGAKNKITRDMKEAVMEAFNRLGGADYLVAVGKSRAAANKRAMLQMFGKMIPMQLTGEGGGAIIIQAAPEDKDL